MLTEGKTLLSAPVPLRLQLFVSPVFPHFGVQSSHSHINPQGVNELKAGAMRTSMDAAGPQMRERSKAGSHSLHVGVIQLLSTLRGERGPAYSFCLNHV